MENKFKVEEENVTQQAPKNKPLIIVVTILSIIIVSLLIFIGYDKLINKENDKSNNSQEENNELNDEKIDEEVEKESQTEINKENDMYILYDYTEAKVYSANVNEYLTSGKKTKIINDIYEGKSIEIYKNQIFYFNTNLKLSVYNIDTKKTTVYDVDSDAINENTIIMPGDDYTILTDIYNFVRLDMKTKEVSEFKIIVNNVNFLYDDVEKILYYMNDYNIESYNVVSGVITKGIGEGYPIYVDEEYVFIDKIDYQNEQDYFILYNKKTKETVSLKRPTNSGLYFLSSYNGDRYFAGEGLLVNIDTANKINIIHDSPYSMMLNTNKSILIVEREIINSDVGSYGGDIIAIYEYDYETGKKVKIDNQYINSLFDDYVVYFVES